MHVIRLIGDILGKFLCYKSHLAVHLYIIKHNSFFPVNSFKKLLLSIILPICIHLKLLLKYIKHGYRCELHRQQQQQQQQQAQAQQHQTFYPFTYYQANGNLHARSRSVPEGLGTTGHHFDYSTLYNNKGGGGAQYCHWINGSNYWQQYQQQQANIRPQVHVVEQMTTSV